MRTRKYRRQTYIAITFARLGEKTRAVIIILLACGFLALVLAACGTIPLAGYDPATRTLRFDTVTEVRNECARRGGAAPTPTLWSGEYRDFGCYDRRTGTVILWTRSFTATERHERCHSLGWHHGEPWLEACE